MEPLRLLSRQLPRILSGSWQPWLGSETTKERRQKFGGNKRLLGRKSGFVSYSCCHKVPPQVTNRCVVSVLEARSLESLEVKDEGKIWACRCHCPCLFTSSPLCAVGPWSNFPFLWGHEPYTIGAHSNDLIVTSSTICKDLISTGHIYKTQGLGFQHMLEGCNSTHSTRNKNQAHEMLCTVLWPKVPLCLSHCNWRAWSSSGYRWGTCSVS